MIVITATVFEVFTHLSITPSLHDSNTPDSERGHPYRIALNCVTEPQFYFFHHTSVQSRAMAG